MATSSSKILLAGIAGLAAGIAIGILFAPAKGSKTRKRLKKQLNSLADNIEKDVHDKLGALTSVFAVDTEEDEEEEEEITQAETTAKGDA